MWTAATSIAALITAVGSITVGLLGFARAGRAEGARQRADAAGVGLQYLERALAAQQETLIRQEGEIGELKGQLKECRDERQMMAGKIEEQAVQITALQRQVT